MTLKSLWAEQRNQLEGKHVRQIISFAGDGKLRDGNATSIEFREFLSIISTQQLTRYIEESLNDKFDDQPYVLQDLVNQIGKRLGFVVTDGRYRGSPAQIGLDGLWGFPGGHKVIVEVKTTDAYQINLYTIARYRREIISQGIAVEDESSILIVIGREDRDTADLEAQIRGSRYAWSVRIISVDALLRLLELKEAVDDPRTIQRISAILIPREFTKLDEIINLVFSAAEDVRDVTPAISITEEKVDTVDEPIAPKSFHEACILRIEEHLKQKLRQLSRTTYTNVETSIGVSCAVSKIYERPNRSYFWFAFHPYHKEFLETQQDGYVAFGCGSQELVLLIPYQKFLEWIPGLNITHTAKRFYWHVYLLQENGKLILIPKAEFPRISLDDYRI